MFTTSGYVNLKWSVDAFQLILPFLTLAQCRLSIMLLGCTLTGQASLSAASFCERLHQGRRSLLLLTFSCRSSMMSLTADVPARRMRAPECLRRAVPVACSSSLQQHTVIAVLVVSLPADVNLALAIPAEEGYDSRWVNNPVV